MRLGSCSLKNEWEEVMDLSPLDSDYNQCTHLSNPCELLELSNNYNTMLSHTWYGLILWL